VEKSVELCLLVDDDRSHRLVLERLLQREGIAVRGAADAATALGILDREEPALVATDLRMPGASGMELLTRIRRRRPALPVIMITGHGDIETAVAAMKAGAHDFITKPVDEREFLDAVRRALAESAGNRRLVSAYFEPGEPVLPELIGDAPAIREILRTVRKVGPSDSTVLITGETGVGKELVAQAIHRAGGRRGQPFIKVNCAAIPESLAESELFGHERGAFTGAVACKPGRFELAHGGTIFLDEIGEMPLALQPRLLTVLQDKALERVGGVKTIHVDVRVIAATNRELYADARAGRFRSDLYYRLNVVPIHVPPLRERREDIVPLLEHFLRRAASRAGRAPSRLAPEVGAILAAHDWPGNIRELENVVERMVLMAEGDLVGTELLPAEIRPPAAAAADDGSGGASALGGVARAAERRMISDTLARTGGNRTRAAELLGISRRTLLNKIKQHDL